MQSKQQSTEKTGVDMWPNVSLTRAELRSKVRPCETCQRYLQKVINEYMRQPDLFDIHSIKPSGNT